ncbi:hypothetical protein [Microbacterium sp. NIBRBAC000506063]|uniref:hypothetical protein n=1 Tax=Microbacterium sp. NIBRBAC000506063 TaxID=2734618 RepID=UPI001BB7761D|nr:hypothetical protein [Microbacterium sp. NIBRBAC000506063]QTV80730.1 hypothetical protein KAE78_10665 [Microbacterium sp. NIBRBAC000506063]
MGLSFSYNSQERSNAIRGITGEYFSALDALGNVPTSAAGYTFAGKTPALVRTDPAISFDWGNGQLVPALPGDYVMGRWTGFLTARPAPTASGSVTTTGRDCG